jgi:hypothetical protein
MHLRKQKNYKSNCFNLATQSTIHTKPAFWLPFWIRQKVCIRLRTWKDEKTSICFICLTELWIPVQELAIISAAIFCKFLRNAELNLFWIQWKQRTVFGSRRNGETKMATATTDLQCSEMGKFICIVLSCTYFWSGADLLLKIKNSFLRLTNKYGFVQMLYAAIILTFQITLQIHVDHFDPDNLISGCEPKSNGKDPKCIYTSAIEDITRNQCRPIN